MKEQRISAADVLLDRLTTHGVDYAFINSGTDYPPLIEAMAKREAEKRPGPQLVVCPHENAAMGMAHGYYLATGKSQAVMVHTNVGLANAACAAINAWSSNIPTLIFGGRTPITERGRFGCRNTPIGYGQEMRDQAALVREAVKWDFELRIAEQTGDLVDRAWAIANSTPKGPVYLSLPREPLCETFDGRLGDPDIPQQPVNAGPDKGALEVAANLVATARQPVIFAQRGAGSPQGFEVLRQLANEWAIPVVEYWATEVAISAADAMAAGDAPDHWLNEADVIIVLNSQAPWMMDRVSPRPDCEVIQIGPDPLFSRYPVRGYRADINLVGEVDTTLMQLRDALAVRLPIHATSLSARHERVSAHNASVKAAREETLRGLTVGAVSRPFFSRCLGQLAEKYDGKIVSELVVQPAFTGLTRPDSYYQEALSGGLGEAFPIALGLQLADRERLVIAALGDGSYMFANPLVCHHIAEAMRLPVLVIIGNNARWGAVAGGVRALYPEGYAAKASSMPGVALSPSPDFSHVAQSCRAGYFRVEKAETLAETLEQAVEDIRLHRRSVMVEVILQD